MANPTLDDAMATLNVALRDPNDKSYSQADKLEALRYTLSEFARLSRYPRISVDVPLTENVYEYDVTQYAEDFLPGRAISARIEAQQVDIVNFGTVMHDRNEASGSTAPPSELGWETASRMWVFPMPGDAMTLTIVYAQPLPALPNPGSEIPYPMEWVRLCAFWGAPAVLRSAEREDVAASVQWRMFEQKVFESIGYAEDDVGDIMPDTSGFL